jgi:hypothetical protein
MRPFPDELRVEVLGWLGRGELGAVTWGCHAIRPVTA